MADELFRLLFDQSLDGLVIASDEGRYVAVNSAACELLGYSCDQLLAMTVAELRSFSGPPSEDRYRAYLAAGKETGEFTFVRPDGEVRTAEYSASKISEGLHLSILRDITERRRAVAEIADLNARLHRAIVESSHRIKNHLQIVAATVDIVTMEGNVSVPLSELQRISAQLRALAVIHDLLTVSSKENALAASVPARALLERVLDMLTHTGRGKQLTFKIDDASLTVQKATSLCLALNEVVSNAFKHGRTSVDVQFLTDEAQGILEVSDDGPGFREGFDPVVSGNTGLQLLHALAGWDLGGRIEFGSNPGGGGRVTVTFPL